MTQLMHREAPAGPAALSLAAHDAPKRRLLLSCPLCEGRRLHYAFSVAGNRLVRCGDCRLMFLNPQPSEAEGVVASSGLPTAAPSAGVPLSAASTWGDAAGDAVHQFDLLARYRGVSGGDLLVIDDGRPEPAAEATRRGFAVTRVRRAPGPGSEDPLIGIGRRTFDVCLLAGTVETAADPLALLAAVRALLRPGGTLAVATPSLDSLSARFMRERWDGLRAGRLTYFDAMTLQTALFRAGYHEAIVRCGRGPVTLGYAAARLGQVGRLGRLARAAAGCAPAFIRQARLPLPAGGMFALSRPDTTATERSVGSGGPIAPMGAGPRGAYTLSIIVPAFNEAATIDNLLGLLLAKRVDGLRIEIIVVESNSTDGTREVVRRYAADPRVRVVLEDRPRGKGHAVRTGLAHASGDFILIQDADLEYDLEDYEALLEPLLAGREALVLGSRHGGNAWWKMRQFAGQPLVSLTLNFGHWFFTTLLNTLFGQKLKDPFTMYKVFRRDCLYGLEFRCNRFDFDYELLVKLIRKGYRPVEIPVNYRSRSFKEGKKVSAFRDPINWLAALAWLRVVKIDPLGRVEAMRAASAGVAARSGSLDGIAASAAELPVRTAA